MGRINPDLYADLEFRGLVKQVTHPELNQHLNKNALTLYCGFDPTAETLHIGSLLPVLTLKRFQEAGHRCIAVVGGATGMIGDPSGKSQERSLLSSEKLQAHVNGIQKCLSRFLDFSGKNATQLMNNADWFQGINYIEFLRDVGKHFTVNHMVAKESVKARLEDREHGISYTEFSYMILQAYDFYVLNKEHGCTLQIGGSDQWGNITEGCELIRRMNAASQTKHSDAFGLTWPLVTKRDGGKFGKSEKGNIWLDADRTSVYEFYQFLVQTADEDVIQYLKYFTFLSHERILELEESVKKAPEKREAQKELAKELTTLVHGKSEFENVIAASQALFSTDICKLDEKTLLSVFSDAPSTEKLFSELNSGLSLVEMVAESGLSKSKGAARKDIQAGGVYVNNERVTDPLATLTQDHLIASRFIVLRKGKKNYHICIFCEKK